MSGASGPSVTLHTPLASLVIGIDLRGLDSQCAFIPMIWPVARTSRASGAFSLSVTLWSAWMMGEMTARGRLYSAGGVLGPDCPVSLRLAPLGTCADAASVSRPAAMPARRPVLIFMHPFSSAY